MEKILKLTGLIAAFLTCSYSYGQQITSAEYFIDADPGTGNGTAITVSSPGDSVNVTGSINLTGVSSGFHSLFIRAKNANGNWSLYEGRRFYVNAAAGSGVPSRIMSAEYFFDTDPGIGNGTVVSTGSLADSVDISSSVNTTGLPVGFHSLFVRVKNESGVWSLYEGRRFNIEAAFNSTSYKIVKAEYFFDNDLGVGNGTAISTGSPVDSVDMSLSASASGLLAGFHSMFVRVQDQSGVWSLYEGRKFYVNSPAPTTPPMKIVRAECFFDTDPGVGNGITISTGSLADSVDIASTITATGLIPGFHGLFIRALNESGVWSLYEGRRFYVDAAEPTQLQIVKAESFFDVDPGVGNAIAISPSFTAADSVDLTRTVSANGIAAGNHFLCVRVQNQLGKWSLVMGDTIHICTTALIANFNDSINGLSVYFTDSSVNASTHKWYFGDGDSSTVVNPNHTYANTGTYNVTLVITDSCGIDSVKIPIIISILGMNNSSLSGNAVIYPNPNDGSFILSYHPTSANSELQIMDITGRMVYNKITAGNENLYQVDAGNLSNGIFYWRIVSGNKLKANGKIVIAK